MASRCSYSARVDAHDHVAFLGEESAPQVPSAPGVLYCGLPGLSVDVEDDRIFFCRIEVGRPDHPAVEDYVTYVYLEEFFGTWIQGGESGGEFMIVLEQPYALGVWEG